VKEHASATKHESVFDVGGPEALQSLLASNATANLACIEKAFGVRINSRDSRIRISSGDPTSLRRASDFLNELLVIRSSIKGAVGQDIFNRLLKAFTSSGASEIRSFFAERIKVGRKKEEIIPRTPRQLEYMRSIRQKDIVFGIGPAGTGKTYLAMAMAVSEFLAGGFSRIILTRPAREAGENLGFLPGTLEEKIMPYLRPLYDALYDMLEFDEVARLMEKRIVEVAPLAFMRGRTLNHSFIILDEAQNTSREQMLMFLTRLGFGSKCVITGDPSQTDLEKNKAPGLADAIKTLADVPEISFVKFSSKDVVRHHLVEKIIDAYSRDEEIRHRSKR